MSWFHKLLPSTIRMKQEKKDVPSGLWTRCPGCEKMLFNAELERQLMVCLSCDYHFPLSAQKRADLLLDTEKEKLFESIRPVDSLAFKDTVRYKDRLMAASKKSTSSEALECYHGTIGDQEVMLACFDFSFVGGSMGSVVGERFAQACLKACALKVPVICVATSGGARMQESLHALMQMTKTAYAISLLEENKLPYIVVLASPCMGGVSASLASLGDIILAEPNALIGFAGPRVIEQTVRQTLPQGFQRSEMILKKGAIDNVVSRKDLKSVLQRLLKALSFYSS